MTIYIWKMHEWVIIWALTHTDMVFEVGYSITKDIKE